MIKYSDNAQQKLQARALILNELITTEQSYVQDLELVVKVSPSW